MAQTTGELKPIKLNNLAEKTRIYDLAKQMGGTSKQIVTALADLGLKRVAQSVLSPDEVKQLHEALFPSTSAKKATAKKATKKAPAKKATKKAPAKKATKKATKKVEEEAPAPELNDPFAAPPLADPFAIPDDYEPTLEADEEQQAEQAAAPARRRRSTKKSADTAERVRDDDTDELDGPRRRRRGKRGSGRGRGSEPREVERIEEPRAIKGSTRLEAQRRRRQERRYDQRNNRHLVSEEEFLARRESVTRTMVVREHERSDNHGLVTQIGVLEDEMLVEHFVTSDKAASMVGNIYLGRVQNVLTGMEAAFVDIGTGRNAVLYAGEVDWRQAGLGGRKRKIEQALKSGDQVLVQVTKDPVGHKGARLTTQISLAGRYLVYVPGGKTAGISRKLPENERHRLKSILRDVMPEDGGAIVRTAAEGVSEKEIQSDVERLHKLWEKIDKKASAAIAKKGAKPLSLYREPDVLIRVVRDLFNEDFSTLVVEGDGAYKTVMKYVDDVAPDLEERVEEYKPADHDGADVFAHYRIDEQLKKALARKVWLPSGGTLIIDRTEAMTVIDVNTGKFTGSGGNLEETVTKNNLEAAEEIVRQMRLRDLGGMIVVDFIDMVLPENRDLVLRRLKEALGRDRTRHQVSEVTSLGLVQMTRKKLGTGLLETFATTCEVCNGRGVIIHDDPVEEESKRPVYGKPKKHRKPQQDPTKHPAALAMHSHDHDHDRDEVMDDDDFITDDNELLENDLAAQAARAAAEAEAAAQADVTDDRRDDTDTGDAPRAGRGRRRARRSADGEEPKPPRSRRSSRREEPQDISDDEATPTPAPAEELAEPATYEEAKEAFDRSPRRKRRVRGNSVSDRAPRPEDFDHTAEVDVDEAAPAAEQGADEPAPRRGRRRATTRNSSSKADEAAPRRSRRAPRAEAEEVTPAEAPAEATTDSGEQAPRRGRRRAVRKSVAEDEAPQRRSSRRPAQSEPEQPVAEPERPTGRRRRAARRATRS